MQVCAKNYGNSASKWKNSKIFFVKFLSKKKLQTNFTLHENVLLYY